jgi:ribosomal protein S7
MFRKSNKGGVLRVNALYTALQFIPIIQAVLQIVLYIAIIYILFGPLPKLIKATLAYLESKKSIAQDIVTDSENVIEENTEAN